METGTWLPKVYASNMEANHTPNQEATTMHARDQYGNDCALHAHHTPPVADCEWCTVQAPHVSEMRLQHRVFSPNTRDFLTVAAVSYGPTVSAASVLAGTARPIEARLSADGQAWHSEWHKGESSGRECYVERYDASGCVFHGWIDQQSRRLTQAG